MHHALAREHATAVVHQRTAQRALIEADGDLVWKSGQHAARDRASFGCALVDIEALRARDGEKLLPKLDRFARRATVHSQASASPRIKIVFRRETKCAQ